MNFPQNKCPITGWPVVQKPEWTDVSCDLNYRVTLSRLGNRVFLVEPFGYATEGALVQALKFTDNVLDWEFPDNRPFIRIEDWSNLKGVSRKGRGLYLDHIKNRPAMKGLIIYGMNTPLKVAVNVASRINVFPFELRTAKDYRDAIQKAQSQGHHDPHGTIGPVAEPASLPLTDRNIEKVAPPFSDPSWHFRAENFSLSYEVIDGNVLHGITWGKLKEEHIAPSFRLMEQTVQFIHSSVNTYYYVLGIKGIEGSTQRARKLYVSTILDFYKQRPFEMLLFYGANRLLTAAINLARPFVPFKVRLVKNLVGALTHINQEKLQVLSLSRKDPAQPISDTAPDSDPIKPYVHDVLRYLEGISWEEKSVHENERNDPAHPFYEVFESIDLIRWEVHDLLEEREKTETSLRQAMEEAENANRAKSDFLSNMSHELRTPLNHIIGFNELVLSKNYGDLTDLQEEFLTDVLNSSHHLLSLINDVLDLSKVEAGKMKLELSQFYLKPLLENSLIMVKEKAHKNRIKLQSQFGDLPEFIQADERKLKQILYNLLSNAVKFTPEGGAVRLSAYRLRHGVRRPGPAEDSNSERITADFQLDADFIEISIIDTGIGIATDYLEKIFLPFEQADNSATRKFQGTGLGLALTKKMVEFQGGRIWAESDGEGQGSIFHFTLPLGHKK